MKPSHMLASAERIMPSEVGAPQDHSEVIGELLLSCERALQVLDGSRDFRLYTMIELIKIELSKTNRDPTRLDRSLEP